MQKYKTLVIFLILTAIWSAFFSVFKFFLWGDLQASIKPDLQTIAGYMSLGGTVSFLVGGALAYTFLKKYFLFFISIFALIFVSLGFFVGMDDKIVLGIIVTFVGVFYGLWTVVKNILISIEIKKTGLQDTTINAIVSIIFIVALIAGSIIGSKLFETFGHNGLYVIIVMLIISSIVSLFLDYDNVSIKSLLSNGFKSYYFDRKRQIKDSMKEYFPDMKFIAKKYFSVIIVSSFLWAISTIVSQKGIEYSANNFGVLKSEAAFVLLYSAVGVIIGNILSMKMEKTRWKYFLIFNIIFGILVIAFPFLSFSFTSVKIVAFSIGVFFGGASNLIDAYYFRKIGEDNKKEYGSATYGLILSFTIFSMMFISSSISSYFGYTTLMVLLGTIILATNILLIKMKD